MARALAAVVCAAVVWTASAEAQIEVPRTDPARPIIFRADKAARWMQGEHEVWLLAGNCSIQQGTTHAQADEAVLWVRRESGQRQNVVAAYLEGDVRVEDPQAAGGYRLADKAWYNEFFSLAPIESRTPPPEPEPEARPAIYRRAAARRDPYASQSIRRTQFVEFGEQRPAVDPPPGGTRRLRAFPRSQVKVQAQWFPNPAGNEWVAVITSGVNLIVDGLDDVGALDVSADRIVIWTAGIDQPDLSGQTLQGREVPLEIYMEGNIVFRQQDRVIYAERMYYDVHRRVGSVLDAELLTPVADYQGLVRLKAAAVRQLGPDRFVAEEAFVTTSRLGQPSYRLASGEIYFEDQMLPQFDPLTGLPRIDPQSGQQVTRHQRLATSRDNLVYLGSLPVFYWPRLATDLEEPTYYIRRVQAGNDNVFGARVMTDWDVYQLLGIQNKPENTDWTIDLDYLSDRGIGHGTKFKYEGENLFNVPGPYTGFLDAWAIKDEGLDVLGPDRRDFVPEKDYRYRVLSRHRQQLPNNFQFTSELGLISDRNFLEEYYKQEWDTLKDQTTGLELKQIVDNMSWSVTADSRVNTFFTQTEWLPRLDHFWIGQPLLGDRLTWFEHSSAAYARMRTASTSPNPLDAAKLAPLPWEATVSGERFATRQELDLPLEAGPVKIVPYVLGEYAHWGEVLDGTLPNTAGDSLDRLYGQAGVRASLPAWNVFPWVENDLFNVHGLAHKVTYEIDAYYADANRNLTLLPLYDPLDDDSQEHFRRRFAFNTFGGVTPITFDERFYALRSGLASAVTSPSTEIADDLAAVRIGWRHRWQTKRGPPGRMRIIDFVTLDKSITWYPRTEDNFGATFGLFNYDFRWHPGDRLTVLSSGIVDFFEDGQQVFNAGVMLSRPPRGAAYLGFRAIQGPVDYQVVSTSYNYRLSPKWVAAAGMSYELTGTGTIGNSLAIVRVGESFLAGMSFNYDAFRDNVGVNFMIEPRFIPGAARSLLGAVDIPPAGYYGLE